MSSRLYNDGSWTSARFFGFVRSLLRQGSQRWPPRNAAVKAARQPYRGRQPRRKWSYRCALCSKLFKRTDVEIDHIVPCGSLTSLEDLPGFVERLFCEEDGFRILCKPCHKDVTKGEK